MDNLKWKAAGQFLWQYSQNEGRSGSTELIGGTLESALGEGKVYVRLDDNDQWWIGEGNLLAEARINLLYRRLGLDQNYRPTPKE